VTLLFGKARSLAARRREKSAAVTAERERDGWSETKAAQDGAEGAEGAAALDTAALDATDLDATDLDAVDLDAAAFDAAGLDGTDLDAADLDAADLDGDERADDEAAVRARLGALFEPPGLPATRLRGRDALLSRLDAVLWAPDARTHVLAGPGGSGKSAVALWLAREATRRGVPAWWVPAADARTVTVRLLELAACIGARPGEVALAKAGQRGAADLLWRYLEQRAPWLLVIDGADDLVALTVGDADAAGGAGWLRRTQNGLVVVTSRVADRDAWGRHIELHAVGPLDPQEGGQVLADLAPGAGSAREAVALSQRLGGLPLALRLTGSQLTGSQITESQLAGSQLAGYERVLDEGYLGERGERGGRAIVAAVREVALEALAAAGRPQARALLRVLGYLAPGVVIPAEMIDLGVLARVCEGDVQHAAGGLRALSAAGLISVVGETSAGGDAESLAGGGDEGSIAGGGMAGIVVHPVVGEASRVYTGDAARAGGVAVGMLVAAAARLDSGEPADWPAWVGLQPHVSAVYGYLGGVLGEQDLASLAGVTAAAAVAFLQAGCTTIGADLAASALRHARRLGAEHPGVLALRNAVARARPAHEGADGAERELRDLLAAQARVLGPEHPDTLGTGLRLARLVARQGEYERAEQSLRELLADCVRALGPDHPGTLTARHDLGLVLAQRGQYAQAAEEFSDLLAARVRTLGPEHRDTRVTRRWLAHMAAAGATVRSG
jgi:hypothetical protein